MPGSWITFTLIEWFMFLWFHNRWHVSLGLMLVIGLPLFLLNQRQMNVLTHSLVLSDCQFCESQDHVSSMMNHVAPVKANQPPPVDNAGRSTDQWDLTEVINNQEVKSTDVNSSPGSLDRMLLLFVPLMWWRPSLALPMKRTQFFGWCCPIGEVLYVRKIWRGKSLVNLANGIQFAKFFSPIASSVMIRQKFSHVRYPVVCDNLNLMVPTSVVKEGHSSVPILASCL